MLLEQHERSVAAGDFSFRIKEEIIVEAYIWVRKRKD